MVSRNEAAFLQAEKAAEEFPMLANWMDDVIAGVIAISGAVAMTAQAESGVVDLHDFQSALHSVCLCYCMEHPEHARFLYQTMFQLLQGDEENGTSLMDLAKQALRELVEKYPAQAALQEEE